MIHNSEGRPTANPATADRAIPRLVLVFAASIAVVMVLAVLRYVLGGETDLFKLGEESNIPTWLSSVQLFLIAVVLMPLAMRDIDTNRARTWAIGLVPLFFAFLSLDEVAKLHERLGDWLKTDYGLGAELRSGPWIFGFVPLVAVLAAFVAFKMWPFLRSRRTPTLLMASGVAILGASAVGLEIAANFAVEDSAVHRALAFAEESGEMIGANLILWGALVVVKCEGIRLDLGTVRQAQ